MNAKGSRAHLQHSPSLPLRSRSSMYNQGQLYMLSVPPLATDRRPLLFYRRPTGLQPSSTPSPPGPFHSARRSSPPFRSSSARKLPSSIPTRLFPSSTRLQRSSNGRRVPQLPSSRVQLSSSAAAARSPPFPPLAPKPVSPPPSSTTKATQCADNPFCGEYSSWSDGSGTGAALKRQPSRSSSPLPRSPVFRAHSLTRLSALGLRTPSIAQEGQWSDGKTSSVRVRRVNPPSFSGRAHQLRLSELTLPFPSLPVSPPLLPQVPRPRFGPSSPRCPQRSRAAQP